MNIGETMLAISKLSSLQRYSQITLSKNESVLEHLGFVTLLNYFIAEALWAEGFAVDIGRLLSKSIVHDLEEIVTGDLPRPFKYSSPELRKTIRGVENLGILQVIKSTELPNNVFHCWRQAKDHCEGSLVSLCDSISAAWKLHEEIVLRGNKTACFTKSDNFSIGTREKFMECSKWFPESKTLRNLSEYVDSIIADLENACGN